MAPLGDGIPVTAAGYGGVYLHNEPTLADSYHTTNYAGVNACTGRKTPPHRNQQPVAPAIRQRVGYQCALRIPPKITTTGGHEHGDPPDRSDSDH